MQVSYMLHHHYLPPERHRTLPQKPRPESQLESSSHRQETWTGRLCCISHIQCFGPDCHDTTNSPQPSNNMTCGINGERRLHNIGFHFSFSMKPFHSECFQVYDRLLFCRDELTLYTTVVFCVLHESR